MDFAPMEGISYHIYRSLHSEMFSGADRYYAPFIAPNASGDFKASRLRDLLPENNRDIRLIPQILCNSPQVFLLTAKELEDLGYDELNLNAGCPSSTVVGKRKGAGMLGEPEFLDNFLEELFSRCQVCISVKTRLGLNSPEEFPALLSVYKKYPLAELTIHCRDRAGMYRSQPEPGYFAAALAECPFPVGYNGNIFSPAAFSELLEQAPGADRFMIGRGAAADPALFRRLRGGAPLEKEELRAFLSRLGERLIAELGEHYGLSRLKELWYYVGWMFPDAEREKKAILKSRYFSDYRSAVDTIFARPLFCSEAGFQGGLFKPQA